MAPACIRTPEGLANALNDETGTAMQALIWVGAALTLVGVAGLVYCVLRAVRARRAGLADEAMRAELQRVVTINMAALGLSALGLGLVVAGILLS
jgi:hypothetical protein